MSRYSFLLGTLYLTSFGWGGPTTAPSSPVVIRTFPRGKLGPDGRTFPPVVSADGSKLCVHVSSFMGDIDRTTVFDVRSGKEIYKVSKPADEMSRLVTGLSPDGTRIIVVTQHNDGSNTLRVIGLADGHVQHEYTAPFGLNGDLLPDGKRLMHAEARPQFDPEYQLVHVAIVDLETGRTVGELKTPRWAAPAGIFSSDSRLELSVDANSSRLTVWDIATSRQISALDMQDHDAQTSLRFIDADKEIRGVNRNGVIRTWDARTGKVISRVEPQHSDLGAGVVSRDGKWIIHAGYGSIAFEDATTARDIRVWRFEHEAQGYAWPDTIRGDTIIVGLGDRGDGDLVLLRMPAIDQLPRQPAADEERGIAARRAQELPATAPSVEMPAHHDADLKSAAWWLDRAEAECLTIKDAEKRGSHALQIMLVRAELDDVPGERRMLKLARECFPTTLPAEWSPIANAQQRLSYLEMGRLVKAGKVDEAIQRAGSDEQALVAVAKSIARTGDVDRACALFQPVRGDVRARAMYSAVWLLLVEGNVASAERLASQMNSGFQGEAYVRIARCRAQQGDINGLLADFAKVPENLRVGAAGKIIAALAQRKDDAGAQRVIEAMPEKERDWARSALAQGQLDRDDLDAARETARTLSASLPDPMRPRFADALVRTGRVNEAFGKFGFFPTFAAAIKYGQLDVAAELIQTLPAPKANSEFATQAWNSCTIELATALAEADRIDDAKKLLRNLAPVTKPTRNDEDPLQGSWAIAAAQRRAGNLGAYNAVRQPLADALKNAPGAPSRRNAMASLLSFDIDTGNFESAEAEMAQCDPELLRGVSMFVMSEFDVTERPGRKPPDLQRQRQLLHLICQSIDRPIIEMAMQPVAKAHADRREYAVWLGFAHHLPSPRTRISAYLMMAELLTPTDPPEPND